MLADVVGQELTHDSLRQGYRAHHPYHAARLGLHLRNGSVCGLCLVAHGRAMSIIDFPGSGQRQLASRPLKQTSTQMLFQTRHPAREARFRYAQGSSGGRKAALADHLSEIQHVVQILHKTPIRHINRTIYRVSAGLSIKTGQCIMTTYEQTLGPPMKLLHIDSSINGANSVSRKLTADIVAQWTADHPDTVVDYLDLAVQTPTHFSRDAMGFRLPPSDAALTESQQRENRLSEALVSQFLDADVVVIGAPLYNFSIPSQIGR